MLNLSVSKYPCVPGKAAGRSTGRPLACEACKAPGGPNGALLEAHTVRKDVTKHLCPMCHACLHLDAAGKMNAGRVIWLPEVSQERLNLLCLAMFVAMKCAGKKKDSAEFKPLLESATRLYGAFERRAEGIEQFLGGNAVKSVMPRQMLSSPLHIAGLISRAQAETKQSQGDVARKCDGMRLLPAPAAFQSFIDQVAKIVDRTTPVRAWLASVDSYFEAANASREEQGVNVFDAGDDAGARDMMPSGA